MTDPTVPVRALYDAMAAHDPAAILAPLDDEFVGLVSRGMPLEAGGRHDGPEAMLRDVWGRVFAAYDMRVEPDELLPAGPDRVVALGRYRGVQRGSGHEVDARFAHVVTVRDGRITRLEQITDTACWTAAA
jgi:ketosteroid isomerase-like protein